MELTNESVTDYTASPLLIRQDSSTSIDYKPRNDTNDCRHTHDGKKEGQDDVAARDDEKDPPLLYGIDDRPPWYLLLLLAFQQFLLAATSQILNPLIIAGPLCIADDVEGMGIFITGIFFVAGFASLLQTFFGVRLPIIQGPSAAFIAPIIMLMNRNKDKCPDFSQHNLDGNATVLPFQAGSDQHKEVWMTNLTELQGALMVAAVVEILIGLSGAIGFLMRYIGPLTTATVLMLIGLSVADSASAKGSSQWWICIMSILLIVLFSQYLHKITIPFFGGVRIKIFLLFPVLLGIGIAWFVCFILTVSDALPDEKGEWGYEARTDIKTYALKNAKWFRFPYPGQWGTPSVSAGGVVAMVAAITASTIESIGDYHACAKLCCVAPPPPRVISRGIGMEGVCCLLGGAWGTGSGFTSYSANVASIGLTKVGSRVVIQLAAVMLIVVGCLGKVGTLFGTVPEPIIGGMIYVMFGMVSSVGVSSLSLVDLNAIRNLFVFGFSVFFGLSATSWVVKNPISVGNETADEVLNIFCSTSMLVGGVLAFVLDNTIPGTLQERGIIIMSDDDPESPVHTGISTYDIPYLDTLLRRIRSQRFFLFCSKSSRNNANTTIPMVSQQKHTILNYDPVQNPCNDIPTTEHKHNGVTTNNTNSTPPADGSDGSDGGSGGVCKMDTSGNNVDLNRTKPVTNHDAVNLPAATDSHTVVSIDFENGTTN